MDSERQAGDGTLPVEGRGAVVLGVARAIRSAGHEDIGEDRPPGPVKNEGEGFQWHSQRDPKRRCFSQLWRRRSDKIWLSRLQVTSESSFDKLHKAQEALGAKPEIQDASPQSSLHSEYNAYMEHQTQTNPASSPILGPILLHPAYRGSARASSALPGLGPSQHYHTLVRCFRNTTVHSAHHGQRPGRHRPKKRSDVLGQGSQGAPQNLGFLKGDVSNSTVTRSY